MSSRSKWPIALTIAGSDSGGGAGIQADLKTFAALGVHGTTAITCVTAQNPRQVRDVQACTPSMVRNQMEAVLKELPPKAAKTGMLYSAAIIRMVAEVFSSRSNLPLIVDPVMVAGSGAPLLQKTAIHALKNELLPRASLITPNLHEAEILTGGKIADVDGLRQAARRIHQLYGCAALVKGGHLRGLTEAVDFYADGREELLLRAPYIEKVSTHGTGCAYSAAITGYLALGCPLGHAVQMGKQFISQAIAQSIQAGRHSVLNCFWEG
jgi:hydroxymethylpyrimidine kinase/phosphomethylpyrimidine kinase